MATRKAGSRLETEIERCRTECQWERIPELVKQLSAKLIANDDMAELLLGESKLEQHLKEKPLRQGASPRGPRPQLTEVRKHLTAALDRGNLKSEFLQESNLIMAKLNCVEGDYKEALNIYARVGLDDLPLTAVPPYRLRMIAEAYATKGLCLEKLPVSSSTSNLHVDREQDVITCYEKAGDIALLYLQEIERVILTNIQNRSPKPGPAPHDQELGFFLETGLQRAHVLYFKNGNLTRGVGRFRELLRAVETRTTQNLRMTIARQLAEILLRGMCEQSYWNPLEDPPCQSPLDDPLRKGANTKTYTLPRRARVYSGEKYGTPWPQREALGWEGDVRMLQGTGQVPPMWNQASILIDQFSRDTTPLFITRSRCLHEWAATLLSVLGHLPWLPAICAGLWDSTPCITRSQHHTAVSSHCL